MKSELIDVKQQADPILSRRSIRRYLGTTLEDSQIRALLDAAMCAPSAEDERPWHFVVVREEGLRRELAEIAPYTHVVKDAPLALVVCGEEALQKQQGCWMLDCAAATENILLEAHLAGLGAVWLGLYPVPGRVERVRRILQIPSQIMPFAIVAAGYPAERREAASRYDGRRVHFEQWQRQEATVASK
jgi:nitroreductase